VTLPIFYIDNRISRIEGSLLLAYYVFYVIYVILRAAESSVLPVVTLLLAFFIPVTFIALIVVAIRSSLAKGKAVRQI